MFRATGKPLIPLLGALALGACALMCGGQAGAAGPGASAARAPARLLGGVNIGGPADIKRARALHAAVVRTSVAWARLQPRGPGQYDAGALAATDKLVNAAAAAGLRVIMLVDTTPCWASSAPAQLLGQCTPGQSSGATAWPPTNPADYANFVAFLAQRYGDRLAALEVWNEPDHSNQVYFAGPHKAERYAALLRAAYPAIKRAHAQTTVLGGSLVGSNGNFLRALYAAGIKGSYDGLAVHFYNVTLGSLRAIRETQLANGDRAPLWLDEFGWSSCWPRQRTQQEQACVTTRTQAANLSDLFRSLARAPYVAGAVVYKLQDSAGEDFGVLTRAGARKPAFAALARVLASPVGNPHPVRLRLRRHSGRVVASGSGPVGDFMQLEAFRGSVLRYRALFTLDRFNRYSVALPGALGTHGLRVRVYQYWSGVARAAKRSI